MWGCGVIGWELWPAPALTLTWPRFVYSLDNLACFGAEINRQRRADCRRSGRHCKEGFGDLIFA